MLSTRPDLVPPRYEAALASLQDAAAPLPYAAIEESVRRELGCPPEQAFASFSEAPIAAASIGQVHAARLHDGSDVVIKVRRPGVTEVVEVDLAILRLAAEVISSLSRTVRRIDPVGFVEEFGKTIRAELDYLAEGDNADRMRERLHALGVHVPRVVWPCTTRAVLTLERIHGTKIDDVHALCAAGVDRSKLARDFATAYLAMVFSFGFFHADPHPGNLFVEAGGRIALVDFGMVGTVPPGIRRALAEILVALVQRDASRSARALHDLGVVPADVEELEFARELERLTAATIDVPIGGLRLAPLLAQLMSVSRRHHLRLPRELALLVKTVVMCEGIAAQIDPAFSLAPVLASFIGRSVQANRAT